MKPPFLISLGKIFLLLFALFAAPQAVLADAYPLTKVVITPAPGQAAQLVGGQIVVSNQGETVGFQELGRIQETPKEGEPVTVTFENTTPYRWVKYVGPTGSHAVVAELKFYAGNILLEGEPFGIAGQAKPEDAAEGARFDFSKAFDDDPETYFRAPLEDGAYVGLDLGTEETLTPMPEITPAPGQFDAPVEVSISVPGDEVADIYYTTDGTMPGPENSTLYAGPFTVQDSARVRAVAFLPGKFASPVAAGLFTVGDAAKPAGYVSFSIGNSLTDTFNGWLEPVAQSAGYDHRAYRFTIPGAPTDWLWDHPGGGFGENTVTEAFPRLAPIDFLTTQPFSGHGRSLDNESEHSAKFWNLARETSPDVQLILYAQWPSRDLTDNWSVAKSDYMKGIGAMENAPTYEDAIANHMLYFEALRERIDSENSGKPVLICPTPLALRSLKAAVEAGGIPGIPQDQFFEAHFDTNDKGPGHDLHMKKQGRYFVALLLFCTMYGEPADAVNLGEDVTGVTAEQDAIYKRIAWETIRDYEWTGVSAR